MAISIILIIILLSALGLKPWRLILKIGKAFFVLVGLYVAIMIVLLLLSLFTA